MQLSLPVSLMVHTSTWPTLAASFKPMADSVLATLLNSYVELISLAAMLSASKPQPLGICQTRQLLTASFFAMSDMV